jgi:hypothetical protein
MALRVPWPSSFLFSDCRLRRTLLWSCLALVSLVSREVCLVSCKGVPLLEAHVGGERRHVIKVLWESYKSAV